MAKISVIVPVYNAECFLERCVDSILQQTFSDFELILVDDGSSDGSGALCDSFASRDGRIAVIHQKNGGVSAARNAGITAATGEFIAFVDSDDAVEKDCFHVLFTLAEQYRADISMVGSFPFDENHAAANDFSETVYNSGAEAVRAIGAQHTYQFRTCWAKLIKSQIVKQYVFPENQSSGEDLATVYKWLFAADRVVKKNIPLYHYNTENEESITHHFKRSHLDNLLVDEMLTFFERHRFTENLKLYAEEHIMRTALYIKAIQQDDPSEKKLLRELRRKLRKAIRQYGDIINLKQSSQRNFVMRTAYPTEFKIRKTGKKVLLRIRTLLRKNQPDKTERR